MVLPFNDAMLVESCGVLFVFMNIKAFIVVDIFLMCIMHQKCNKQLNNQLELESEIGIEISFKFLQARGLLVLNIMYFLL